jgi:hypothetical protein
VKRRVPSALWGDYAAQLAHFTKPLENGCWEFTGYVLPSGYGQLGRNVGAHRIAWEVANGRPIPAGLVIDHTCHNADLDCHADTECPHRRCVNPAHLEAVSSATNILRGHSVSPINAAKTHCDNGHEFTAENTYYRPDRFGRICITCRDDALRRDRHKWTDANRERAREWRRNQKPLDFAIREWAIAAGLPCSMSGPISRKVRAAYAEATRSAA